MAHDGIDVLAKLGPQRAAGIGSLLEAGAGRVQGPEHVFGHDMAAAGAQVKVVGQAVGVVLGRSHGVFVPCICVCAAGRHESHAVARVHVGHAELTGRAGALSIFVSRAPGSYVRRCAASTCARARGAAPAHLSARPWHSWGWGTKLVVAGVAAGVGAGARPYAKNARHCASPWRNNTGYLASPWVAH